MEAKIKAEELINKFLKYSDTEEGYGCAKESASICVNEITKELYNTLKDTDELQNSDSLFRYWDNVLIEIQNY
jgi:hypothetical protein